MANRISEVSLITNTNEGQQDYYIEPLMYAGTTSGTSSAYTISLANFEVVNGASLQLTFNSRNSAGATLSVNGSSPVTIYYNGESVAANQIKDQSTHTLIFKSDSNGNRWIIADSDTTYSAGTGLDLTGNTFSVKYGTTAGTAAAGNDSRLSDARTPKSHKHGNIENDGTLGTTASRAVVTDSNKKITVADLTFADPSASTTDTSLNFIDTISQDSQGKISATKKPLPKVSATSDGIVPKGVTVSTQSTSTKFLREDGTWAAPSYITNITRSDTTFTVTRNDDSTFTFTQQDKYHKSGSWSGLTYTATAVNSAEELKFTIPNKIQTNWELNATSGNSPALLFTRNSSLTDWKIFVTSGKLSFQSATDGSTWTERAYFKDNSGDFVATSFTGNGFNLTDLNASNISSGTLSADRLPIATNDAFGAVKTGDGITNTNGVISVTASNLGLSNAMHFIGIATKAITDGGTEDPTIDGYSTKTAGDVVIDKDTRREYVWSTANKWELLGFDASTKYEKTTSGNTFISKITQATDGTITAESRALDTRGEWSGNAVTATTATSLSDNPSLAASGNDITVTAGGKTSSAFTVPYATKALNDVDGNAIKTRYVTVYNTHDIGKSSTVTFTDLAAAGNAVGMIYAATDNPEGKAAWVHSISLAWTKGTTSSWISQIALGVNSGTGMWYRTTQGNIAGRAWTRILDDSNYSNYALSLSGGVMDGAITFNSQSSAFNNSNIIFSSGGIIGGNTSGAVGIYASTIYLRGSSNNSTNSSQGILISGTQVDPYGDNAVSLGTSTLRYKNIHSVEFTGNLTGNADTATTAEKLGTSTVGSARQPIYLDSGNAEVANFTVAHFGNAGKTNMNDIGRLHSSTGMTKLNSTGNADTPKNGTNYSSGWHLYWDTNFSDDPNQDNAWVAQIVNRAGSSDWWVRSRNGGAITNGTAWASNWRHLVTSTEAAVGSATQPVYINEHGEVETCTKYADASVASATDATNATNDSDGNPINETYLKLTGGTMTGDINMETSTSGDTTAADGTIILANSGTKIVQKMRDTSNWGAALTWDNATHLTNTYLPGIGYHNTGHTISIIPYATNTNPWGRTEGLSIGASDLKFENELVAHAGNITNKAATLSRNSTITIATIAGVNITVTTPKSDNTWRGIQDNLTSSSNTTESLSAKQGYLLANGSARDDTKLPLAGGTMTGDITFTATTFSSNPTDSTGLVWSGGTDSAKIFYRQTAKNNGSLVLYVADDGEEYINFLHSKGQAIYLKPSTREFYPSANNTGSLGTTSYKWANVYATTFNGNLIATHVAGGKEEIKVAYSDTISFWLGVSTGNENHGLYDDKAGKWILSAGTANTWTFVGNVTGNVSGSAGSVAWANTGHPDTFPPSSHTHPVSEITWAGGQNLTTSATANGQEWSLDLSPGSYTGTYWHVWSTPKGASILRCYTDDRHITMPGNIASTSTSTGTLQVTGGIGVSGQVTAARLAAGGSNTSYNLYVNGTSCFTDDIDGNYINLAGNFNTTNLKKKDADRPGMTISGDYPQIALISGRVNNKNHGSTITLAGYDSGTATSGAFKAFTFGTPGYNVTWMDLGYGTNDNPHAQGINGYTGTHIMRWQNDGKVGIGTREPEYKLDVNGDIHTSNTIIIEDVTLQYNTTDKSLDFVFA